MSLRQFVPPPFRAPWSHAPGIEAWLAGADVFAKIFPTRLELHSCQNSTISISFPGLCYSCDWTVFFDTLRQRTIVQGHAKSGFFRYQLKVLPEGIFLNTLKGELVCENKTLKRGEKLLLMKGSFSPPRYAAPRLFLGVNKDPNLDRMLERQDPLEILPMWFQLASPVVIPEIGPSLLGNLVNIIKEKDRANILEAFLVYFRAGMKGYFVPQSKDVLYLGYGRPIPENMPSQLIHGIIASLMRSLFLQQEGSTLSLLPCLPKGALSGHLLRERLSSSSLISLEWRKQVIRRVLIHAYADEELTILPHSAECFYLTTLGKKERCKIAAGSKITLQRGNRYLLDNFK
jgi:hypothetical protein